jgi:hypothetical protein
MFIRHYPRAGGPAAPAFIEDDVLDVLRRKVDVVLVGPGVYA